MSAAFPLPDTDWEPLREFWAGAARGELVIPRCRACARWVWYPRETCPGCDRRDLAWTAVSGRGRLYSWAVVRRGLAKPFADRVPYAAGLVALEEDPAVRLVTNLVDCDLDALRVDEPVHVVFRPLRFSDAEGEVTAPMFTPTLPATPAPTGD
jgi:uncharacterized protein